MDAPWGYGCFLEWATFCPPSRYDFVSLPRIRSASQAFDFDHPEIAAADSANPNQGILDELVGEPALQGR